MLGFAYDEGKGAEKDVVESQFWVTLAAEPSGAKPVVELRDAGCSRLTRGQRVEVDQRVQAWQPIPSEQPRIGAR